MASHLVFGAGLIGSFVGGVLSANQQRTHLICRPSVAKALARGVKLTDYIQHEAKTRVHCFTDVQQALAQAGHPDVIWLTVKCTSIAQACEEMAPLVADRTVIICCQNGLGSDAAVKKAFPDNVVLRAMVPFNVAQPSSGHLHRGSEGQLTIEKPPAHESAVDALVEALRHPLLPVGTSSQMQALLWAKLQLNLGNSVNALADIPVKSMLEKREYRVVIATLMEELLSVTAALEIDLPKVTALPARWIPKVLRLPTFLFKRVANKMLAIDPTVRTSMWWDLNNSRPTEIDHLNGAVVREGSKLGLACSANRLIVSLIRQAEAANRDGAKRQPLDAVTLLQQIKAQAT